MSMAQNKREGQGVVKSYFRDINNITDIGVSITIADNPRQESRDESKLQVNQQKPFYMAIKTNMLYDAMVVPNIGIEFYLGRNLSVAANWHSAWLDIKGNERIWRNYGGDIALRRWFGKRAEQSPLSGHHVGLYGQAVTYDVHFNDRGYFANKCNWTTGVEYGYSLPIARRLNIDFTLGLGYHWGEYHNYTIVDDHKTWTATNRRHYVGPTKCEVSLVWLIGRDNYNPSGKRN